MNKYKINSYLLVIYSKLIEVIIKIDVDWNW